MTPPFPTSVLDLVLSVSHMIPQAPHTANMTRRICCCIRAGRARHSRKPKRQDKWTRARRALWKILCFTLKCLPVVLLAEASIHLGWLPTNYYELGQVHVLSKTTAHSMLNRPLAGPAGQLLSNYRVVATLSSMLAFFGILAMVCCMMGPRPGGNGRRSVRDPPSWDPNNEARYSFRTWNQDLVIWSISAADTRPTSELHHTSSRGSSPRGRRKSHDGTNTIWWSDWRRGIRPRFISYRTTGRPICATRGRKPNASPRRTARC